MMNTDLKYAGLKKIVEGAEIISDTLGISPDEVYEALRMHKNITDDDEFFLSIFRDYGR